MASDQERQLRGDVMQTPFVEPKLKERKAQKVITEPAKLPERKEPKVPQFTITPMRKPPKIKRRIKNIV